MHRLKVLARVAVLLLVVTAVLTTWLVQLIFRFFCARTEIDWSKLHTWLGTISVIASVASALMHYAKSRMRKRHEEKGEYSPKLPKMVTKNKNENESGKTTKCLVVVVAAEVLLLSIMLTTVVVLYTSPVTCNQNVTRTAHTYPDSKDHSVTWGGWGSWTAPPAGCVLKEHTRTRVCVGGAGCAGVAMETRAFATVNNSAPVETLGGKSPSLQRLQVLAADGLVMYGALQGGSGAWLHAFSITDTHTLLYGVRLGHVHDITYSNHTGNIYVSVEGGERQMRQKWAHNNSLFTDVYQTDNHYNLAAWRKYLFAYVCVQKWYVRRYDLDDFPSAMVDYPPMQLTDLFTHCPPLGLVTRYAETYQVYSVEMQHLKTLHPTGVTHNPVYNVVCTPCAELIYLQQYRVKLTNQNTKSIETLYDNSQAGDGTGVVTSVAMHKDKLYVGTSYHVVKVIRLTRNMP